MSMSVKDYLIRILAVKMMVSEKTIEKVINHQFQAANDAMQTNDSVEIAGFGKFYFNKTKAKKRVEDLKAKVKAVEKIVNNENTTEQKRKSAIITLENAKDSLNQLKARIKYED